jgi:MFS family permease
MSSNSSANANLIAAIAALACCNIAIGLMVQVIPLSMEAAGLSARLIGLNTALGQMGVFLSGLALPALTRRISSKPVVLFAIGLLVTSFLAFAASDPLWWWYAIRFANGFGIAALFTLSETWITMAAGQGRRARVMGIYTSVLTVTFGIGPFVVAAIGFQGALPWLVGAACMVPGFLGVFLVKAENPDTTDKSKSFLAILRKAPTIYICILAATTFEACSLSFFTIYGMRNGLSYATANQILGTGIIGCLLLFYPIGQMADRWSRGGTAMICAIAAIVFSVATALTITSPAIWPVTILLRAGAFGVYIVAITSIGDSFKGNELVSASALVAIGWGIGGMAGPPVVGWLIDSRGIGILPWALAACYSVALLALLLNGRRMA